MNDTMHPERKHIRLRNFDYSSEGWYFITICTRDRVCYFGEIKEGKFYPSAIGKQAEIFWNSIPDHFENIELGEFVVMPNHIHGVLGIVGPPIVGTPHGVSVHGLPHGEAVGSENIQNKFGTTIPGSISAIISQFKSSLSRWCNLNKHSFGWQMRFHDHVIRDQGEFDRIENYIRNNVGKWGM